MLVDAKIFIKCLKLFNEATGFRLNGKEAVENSAFLAMYADVMSRMSSAATAIPKSTGRKSIRLRSLEQTDLPSLDQEVLDYIRECPASARFEIATAIGRRISSVCGAARRLIDLGLIATGPVEAYDPKSNRHVETLIPIEVAKSSAA